jgi:hypothetical protein
VCKEEKKKTYSLPNTKNQYLKANLTTIEKREKKIIDF